MDESTWVRIQAQLNLQSYLLETFVGAHFINSPQPLKDLESWRAAIGSRIRDQATATPVPGYEQHSDPEAIQHEMLQQLDALAERIALGIGSRKERQ